jgi:hypothetical protein
MTWEEAIYTLVELALALRGVGDVKGCLRRPGCFTVTQFLGGVPKHVTRFTGDRVGALLQYGKDMKLYDEEKVWLIVEHALCQNRTLIARLCKRYAAIYGIITGAHDMQMQHVW